MTPERSALVARLHALLDGEGEVREVRMFGGIAFMLRDAMAVNAGKAGDLLIRVDDARGPELAKRDGAAPSLMGEREMGPGWVRVSAHAIAGDDDLAFWVGEALAHNRSVTGAD
ncbi:TfoX/Sxy family protein [uncultured Corynebacterium sp.]|uniref:TfoX/Sxy family protein n=1 Tax=uncultured Corynebacterium sp. TaxID=159447 RepID=UPI0025F0FC30|nr:TfoX/Sxy family protein [uncultured Corynebacterium sp.]